ncbi:MAG: type II toxin-antitoxin system VapC family toxin [Propionicimonas sp.]
MRIVLDTDVSSLLLKRTLPPGLLAQLAPHEAAITFVTVGELRKWAVVRQLGARRRAELDAWVDARPKIPAGADVARTWGEIVGYAERRGRPRPVNDSWIAACCLTYDLPLATLNTADFHDYATYEGLQLLAP